MSGIMQDLIRNLPNYFEVFQNIEINFVESSYNSFIIISKYEV
jgi:hypothetical protein